MKYALVLSACLLYPLAHAEVAVIVHPSNAAAMDADFVNKLYLGREKSFPGGGPRPSLLRSLIRMRRLVNSMTRC